MILIKKHKLELQTSKALTHMTDNPIDDFSDSQKNSINSPTGFTSPPLFYTNGPKLTIELPHFIPYHYIQHPTLPNYSNYSIQLQMTISLITLLSRLTLTAQSKYIPKQIILFLRQFFSFHSFYLSTSV